MSMLSSMCERLRATADTVERIKNNNADWLRRDVIALTDAARELRQSADTIDYLRRTCNDLQFENEKLRELVRIAVEYCANGYCAEEDECPLYESRTSCKLYAKARELGIEA